MSRNKKILLGIGGVLALCLCAAGIAVLVFGVGASKVVQSFKTDPTSIAQVSSRIADFDVPAGYQPSMAMSILSYDYVMLTPQAGRQSMVIALMQFKGLNSPDMQQMRQSMEQQSGQAGANLRVVKTYQTTIRGESTTVTIQEGNTGAGADIRQLLAIFNGKGGPTMLMIEGPVDGWDQSLVDQFIASIR